MTSAEKFLMEIGNVDDEFIEEAMNFTMKKKFNWKPIIAVAACAAFALAAIPVAKHFANNNLIDGGTTAGTAGTAETPATSASISAATSATTGTPVVPGNKYKVFYAGGSDGGLLGEAEKQKIETDFDGLSVNFTDKTKNGTTKTVEIAGETYTGVYVNSTKSDYYKDDTDNYFVEVDNKKVTFSINTETGVCTNFYVADENPEIGKVLTRDECYAKAVEHLKRYIKNFENFELTRENKRVKGYGYYLVWQRTVNGYKTSEAISVSIRENGEVYAHVLQSANSIEDFDVSPFDMQEIKNAIDSKVNNIYAKYSDIKNNINSITLARCADGEYIFVYDVNVEISDATTGNIRETLDRFVIELN